MRIGGLFLTLAAGALLLGSPFAAGQDRSPFRVFRGETAHSRSKAAAPKRERKREREKAAPLKKSPAKAWGGPKRVEIDLSAQVLRAWEGNRLVLRTRISSGRGRSTPTGRFRAGWKDADHYSTLYHNAPMPWSVQVSGNIFIHGYTEVPNYPASHGCIRVPLTGINPAKRFFQWCDPGTPISVFY